MMLFFVMPPISSKRRCGQVARGEHRRRHTSSARKTSFVNMDLLMRQRRKRRKRKRRPKSRIVDGYEPKRCFIVVDGGPEMRYFTTSQLVTTNALCTIQESWQKLLCFLVRH